MKRLLVIGLLCFAGLHAKAQQASGWMATQKDETPISALCIPGTHDSGARFENVARSKKCQELTITQQLYAGVRALDIRCRHISNKFNIHHGEVYQNLDFGQVLYACTSFLKAHPSETILMLVKEEYQPENNTRTFADTFKGYLSVAGKQFFYQPNALPRLGEARGKIILLRRFKGDGLPGLDVSKGWADNGFSDIAAPAHVKIQDAYRVTDIQDKRSAVAKMLAESVRDKSNTLYINYLSGYKPLPADGSDIIAVKEGVLPWALQTIKNTGGNTGVIMADFITPAAAALIISNNNHIHK